MARSVQPRCLGCKPAQILASRGSLFRRIFLQLLSGLSTCQLVKYKPAMYVFLMKTMPVGELKAQFSEVLEMVQNGESFGILYGKKKKPIAIIVPYQEHDKTKERKLVLLEGKATAIFADDFSMTEEELLGI